MATAYTPILQLALPVTGELQGTWGTVVNDNITSMIEQAIAGLATISTWTAASHTLTTANGTTDEARCAVLECSGAPGAAATVVCPALSKVYVIKNSVTGGYAVTLKTSAGTGISVPNGSTALLYCDGTNVVSGATYMATVSTTQVDILAQGDLRLQDTTGGEYVAIQAPATLSASYTLTMPTDDGTAGQALITDGSGVLSWSTAASGDVYGPASATDNAIARFDLTTGKLIQNSVVTIADTTGNMAGVGTLSSGAITSSALTSGRVPYAGTAGLIQDSAAFTFDGTILSATRFAGALNGTVGATTASTGAFTTLSASSQLNLTNASNYNLNATGAGTNYMAGALGIGSLTSINVDSLVVGRPLTGGTGSSGVVSRGQIQVDVTSLGQYFASVATQIVGATTSQVRHYAAAQGTFSGTVTNQFGFYADASLTGATNNYGFFSNIAAGTNRFNFYANGTADNYFQGKVGIGTAPYSNLQLLINGTVISTTTSAYAVLNTTASDTNTSVAFTGFFTQLSTSTTALTQLNYYYANQGTFSGTVATQRGFYVTNTLTGATTNIGFNSDIAAGTGRYNFWAGGTAQNVFQGQTSLGGAIGSEALRATPVASSVNYVEVNGAVTTGAPILVARGSDTNVGLAISSRGTGSLIFSTNSTTATQFIVANTTSAVNYLEATGAATAGAPVLSAAGTDTNIDLTLTPKGTGVLKFGTHTVGILAQSGYITIKDAAGNTRNLLVG